MKWLYQTVAGKSPLQFRFEFALWTREMIRLLLGEQLQLKLSLAGVGRLLKQLGLTCQRPLFRATEQDPQRVRRWRRQEYPAIREEARRCGADATGPKRPQGRIAPTPPTGFPPDEDLPGERVPGAG
jgi:hypothetical protein